ncbi:MAG: ABC transporter permease [Thermoplasmata archaeon]|jgi:ABC-2 type transport system permease protein
MIRSIRIAYRILRAVTDVNTLGFLLIMPILYLIIMAIMMGSFIGKFEYHNIKTTYITFLTPGIMSIQVLTGGNVAGWSLWMDKRTGMLEQIFSMPYRRSDYLIGIVIAMTFVSILSSLIMLIFAYPFINIILTPLDFLFIIIFLFLGTLFFGMLNLTIGIIVKSNQFMNLVSNILYMILTFASSVFYPISGNLPKILIYISYTNPLTYVSNSVRDLFYNILNSDDIYSLFILSILSLLMTIFTVFIYRKIKFVNIYY